MDNLDVDIFEQKDAFSEKKKTIDNQTTIDPGEITAILTDYYQISMVYTYWKTERTQEIATFEMFFRKNPFGGEFTVNAGFDEVVKFLRDKFRFTERVLAVLNNVIDIDPEDKQPFYSYLKTIDFEDVEISYIEEGRIVFPRTPLVAFTGRLPVLQLVETTVLNLCGYASLVATNAARMRLQAPNKKLLEFGLRRAQGPNGGMSASVYSYIGGFDGTSNTQAAGFYKIPCAGTHAHSFVNSYTKNFLDKVKNLKLKNLNDQDLKEVFLWDAVIKVREENSWTSSNEKELAAFVSYAYASPNKMLALVDTYGTQNSGIPNFLCVAVVLTRLGYTPVGIRLDSGDLSFLSNEARKMFKETGAKYGFESFKNLKIVASNDIDESVLKELNEQGNEIDVFGIGTNLVTCKTQPALGMVYKLVECEEQATIKLSEQIEKITIPGRKRIFRIYTKEGPFVDLLTTIEEDPPKEGVEIFCRHPFIEMKRMNVVPSKVEELTNTIRIRDYKTVSLSDRRDKCSKDLQFLRNDYKRTLNPACYKVSVTDTLYRKMHKMIEDEAPISTYK